MQCPDRSTLQAYIDGEVNSMVKNELENHLDSCPVCSRRLNEISQIRDFCYEHLKDLPHQYKDLEVTGMNEVWMNLNKSVITKRKGDKLLMKFKKFGIAAAIVLTFTFLMSIPSVQVMAENLLQVFRMEKMATISFTTADLDQIESALYSSDIQSFDIDNIGTFETDGDWERTELKPKDLENLPFEAKMPAAPYSEKIDSIVVEKNADIEMKLKVENVNKIIKSLGSEYSLPEVIDGKTFKIDMPQVLEVSFDKYELIQGPSPEIHVPAGVDVNEVAKAVIALPIWPDHVKKQLEAIENWENTLPVPTIEGEQETVGINANEAIYIEEIDTKILIWQDNGIMYYLNGFDCDKDDLVNIAESLR